MFTRISGSIMVAALVAWMMSGAPGAIAIDFGGALDKAAKGVQKAKESTDKAAESLKPKKEEAPAPSKTDADKPVKPAAQDIKPAAADAPQGGGKVLFSKSPIDPANPSNLATDFKAGDQIYGLIQTEKPWRELYKAKGASEVGFLMVMKIGANETYQYITLKKAEDIDSSRFVLDIAPEPDKMTAYKNPDVSYGEGKGRRKIGPIAFTYELAQLPAGKHSIRFYVKDFGNSHASGDLTIEGENFKFYADLHEKVKEASEAIATMPPAKMVNKELEAEMLKLLKNAGWPDVLRLVIVDKDWWIDYVDGSDSPVKSRHMDAAAAAKDKDGACYYCIVQFHEPKLIDGSWGKLELSSTGQKRKILEQNINK